MSSIKVIDINEEAKQEETVEQPIEEAKEEVSNEVVEELPIVDTKEEPKEEVNEVAVEKKVSPQDKMVRCPKCNKEMKLKSFRYFNHEKTCSGTLEQKPVKPFSKPRATPKPKAQPIVQDVEEEIIEQPKPKPKLTQPVSNQVLKPSNPLNDITNHYQLLQQQFIQQKKEKYNNLCQSMFSTKSKKR